MRSRIRILQPGRVERPVTKTLISYFIISIVYFCLKLIYLNVISKYVYSKIQKEELRALIASIKSLENCIQPFLDECDADNDQTISDKEWAKCLDLSDGNTFTYIYNYIALFLCLHLSFFVTKC